MIELGTSETVRLDLDRLVTTRLLVAAMSGAGKSYLLRRLLEQTHGKLQHLVIDPEGEFYTLRERYDYVLARPKGDGDCPAEPRTAGMLARSLLELGVSAILDIYELSPRDRILFVKNFLTELVNAPKKLWHPALVVVDEAATFAPQDKDAESSTAIMELMTKGRKRGMAGILATQRISMIDKNAIAQAGNYLIGRNTLDIDVQRACKTLGFSKQEDQMAMRRLKDGQFFVYGPAFKLLDEMHGVVLTQIGGVETTHPKAGVSAPPPAAPRAATQKALAKLIEIPAEQDKKEKTEQELRAEIQSLKGELRQAHKTVGPAPEVSQEIVDKAVEKARKEMQRQVAATFGPFVKGVRAAEKVLLNLSWPPDEFELDKVAVPLPVLPPQMRDKNRQPDPWIANSAKAAANGDQKVTPSIRKILIALAQYPDGMEKTDRLAALSGYTVNGHFNNMLGFLRGNEFITPARVAPIQITEAGLEALGDYDPLPTGVDLQNYWVQRVGPSKAKILMVLFANYPTGFSAGDLAEASGYTVNGHFNNMIGSLRTMGLITPPRQPIKAMDYLFEE